MKTLTILLFLTSTSLFSQTAEYKDWVLFQRLPTEVAGYLDETTITDTYKISDFINPFYLEADFNNDNILDIAITVAEKASGKKGILIIHRETDSYYIVGAGKRMGNAGDDFDWMNIWRVDRTTAPHALQVIKSESGGGLISWDGENYVWTQRGD